MADPRALDGLSSDERQELKEAVCDAVLERARQVVSGAGQFGTVIFSERPARKLASGFILPRLDEDGDDESSDIRIASHGLDFRVLPEATGTLVVQPAFNVYVRALPTTEELFFRNGWLIPQPGFSLAAKTQIRDTIRQRTQAEIPADANSAERFRIRSQISREVHLAMGVVIQREAPAPAVGDDPDMDDAPTDDATAPDNGVPAGNERLRIPSAVSQRYDVPLKWIRLAVEVEPLLLPLPCDPDAWTTASLAYKTGLITAVKAAYRTWLASPEGRDNAWRKLHPPSEAFWSRANWDNFLIAARGRPIVDDDVIPDFDVQILAQALPDPIVPGAFTARVAIENLQEKDITKEFGLFGVELTLDVPVDALGPMRLERVRRSYHLAGFMTMPAIGVNGGVNDLGVSGGHRRLRTTWMPRFVLPRTKATEISAVLTHYDALGLPATEVGALEALSTEMERWIEQVARTTVITQPGEQGTEQDEAAQRTRFGDDLQVSIGVQI